jgi:hypothetical protein
VVVWSNRSFSTATSEILLARTHDGGRTFTAPVRVSKAFDVIAVDPEIAIDGEGIITVFWTQADPQRGIQDVFLSRSTDRGQTFSQPINVSLTNSTQTFTAEPALGLDRDGNLHVVYTRVSLTAQTQDIFYAVSSAGGEQFNNPVNLTRSLQTSTLSAQPSIIVDATGNINVVYVQVSFFTFFQEIFLHRSTDGGKTFSRPTNVSNILRDDAFAYLPAFAVDASGNLAAVWTAAEDDRGEADIFFAHSSDGGRTFSPSVNVSRTNALGGGVLSGGSVAIDSEGTVSVVWADSTQGNYEVFFSRSLDGGRTFSEPVNISTNQGLSAATLSLTNRLLSQPPTIIATSAGQVAIAWDDDTAGVNRIMVIIASTT